MLNFYPNFIDNTNFKYLNIDEQYISTISIIGYPRKMGFMDFMNIMPKDINYEMSIFVKKQDKLKMLKEITYNISNSKAEMRTTNKNQIDIDILDKITNDAKSLRHEIQINNEEVYYIYILIAIIGDNKEDILYKAKRFRNILYSKMIISNLLNFRHLDGYLSTLPLNTLERNLLKSSNSIMTTSNFANIFPFFTDTIFDRNGVIFGYTKNNKKICNIDIFSNKYTNSNMCIFGSSGSGKSYFVKLLILRHYIKNIKQYIFDPEGEYVNIALQSGGEYITFNNNSSKYFNILDINEIDLMQSNFLKIKVDKIYEFLNVILDVDKSQENIIKNAILNVYIDKGINENKDSMYITEYDKKVFVNKVIKGSEFMPTLEDVFLSLKSEIDIRKKESRNLITTFEKVLNNYNFLKNRTNINMDNSLIIYNLSGLNAKIANLLFNTLIDNIIEKSKNVKEKTIIYIDEVWKFIYNNENSAEKIFMLYKTIRKLNAAIVTITQDISDFFNKDMGIYGKSIFNNSFIKMFFKVEYSDSEMLQKMRDIRYF